MTLNIPGFTAEASLANISARYQAMTDTVLHGGIVQPAESLQEVDTRHALPDRSRLPPEGIPCREWRCLVLKRPGEWRSPDPRDPKNCEYWYSGIGSWNSSTGQCENVYYSPVLG